MSQRHFPDWLRAYMEYTQYSEAPDKFHFWTGVSVIAGALRRRVWMDMGYYQWTPNMYIVFVAPPGIVSKSTTANIGMKLLKEIDGIKFGPDAVTWQALAQSLAQSTEMFEYVEKETGEVQYHSMSAITIVSSEFGTFLNPNDREMVDVLVSLWDGQIGAWKKATKTMGDDVIENPWMNIIACTTPDWIAGNFPEYMIGGGFTSRTVFVYADQKRQYVAYPKYALNPTVFEETRKKLIHDLEIIATEICGEYELSPEARKFGEEWYLSHHKNKPPHLDNERFLGYLARKQTHVHKLAMVLTASRSNSLIIERDMLEAAVEIVTALEGDMPQVFSNIGRSDTTRLADTIIRFVHNHGGMEKIELYRHVFKQVPFKDFQEVIEAGVNAGYLKLVAQGGKIFVFPDGQESLMEVKESV
jgi:hypothetical protein